MTAPAAFTTISLVPASSDMARTRIVTPAGVNDELFPFPGMTVLRTLRGTFDPANSASLRAGPQLASAVRRHADRR
jgi:hypothetical protein